MYLPPVFVTICITMGLLLSVPTICSAEISEQDAIERANKAVSKFDVRPPKWLVQVDKDGKAWELTRSRWKEKQTPAVRKEVAENIAEIEATLKDRKVWTIIYKRLVPPGKVVFDNEALVFLDSTNGEILSIINQEGGIEIYTSGY